MQGAEDGPGRFYRLAEGGGGRRGVGDATTVLLSAAGMVCLCLQASERAIMGVEQRAACGGQSSLERQKVASAGTGSKCLGRASTYLTI